MPMVIQSKKIVVKYYSDYCFSYKLKFDDVDLRLPFPVAMKREV